jgi:hypothetical protein
LVPTTCKHSKPATCCCPAILTEPLQPKQAIRPPSQQAPPGSQASQLRRAHFQCPPRQQPQQVRALWLLVHSTQSFPQHSPCRSPHHKPCDYQHACSPSTPSHQTSRYIYDTSPWQETRALMSQRNAAPAARPSPSSTAALSTGPAAGTLPVVLLTVRQQPSDRCCPLFDWCSPNQHGPSYDTAPNTPLLCHSTKHCSNACCVGDSSHWPKPPSSSSSYSQGCAPYARYGSECLCTTTLVDAANAL